jgi:2-polyprenyl-3-methyl-5-hydroxy-6-metoxy-1,4-benzoquinol methylase
VGTVLDSTNRFEVIACERCRFRHIIPIPSPAELATVYRHEYYTAEKPLYLQRAREDLDWWNLVWRDRFDAFEQYLPSSKRRILDVGSGPGFFLLYGRQRGWGVTGIEPSAQAAEHTRQLGLSVIQEFLTPEIAPTLGNFDVIHCSEVLEHVSNPHEFLILLRSLLNPGGLICAVVPNDYNPFQFALRDVLGFPSWWVAPPHHINYFDFDSLEHLLTDSGFDLLLREATFPIDLFLLMGDNYVGNDDLGRQCHARRKRLERNLSAAGLTALKRQLYAAITQLGIGREALVLARKSTDHATEMGSPTLR